MRERPGRLGVGIVGMGHVGPVLGSALRAAGHTVLGVSAASPASRERAAAMLPGVPVWSTREVAARAQLVLLAVPDDQLAPLVRGLARLGVWRPGQIVVHTCAGLGARVLAPASERGAIPLAIHPAMSFTGMSVDVARLQSCPFAVSAPAPVLPIAQALVVEMGGDPVVIAERDRPLYAAALDHAADHLVVVVAQAMRALEDAGVAEPQTFLRPLLTGALDRVLSEREGALSGPVARGDLGSVSRHAAQLRAHPDLADAARAYAELAQASGQMLVRAGRMRERQFTALRSALLLADAGLEDGRGGPAS